MVPPPLWKFCVFRCQGCALCEAIIEASESLNRHRATPGIVAAGFARTHSVTKLVNLLDRHGWETKCTFFTILDFSDGGGSEAYGGCWSVLKVRLGRSAWNTVQHQLRDPIPSETSVTRGVTFSLVDGCVED